MRRLVVVLLVLAAAAAALVARERLERDNAERRQEQQLLYLPNGKYLRVASLGHATLLADWLYIWAIQYYSDYERADRYRYVEHVFGEVITELDPHYVDPYWLGALIMIVEAHDLEAGLRLLDKGFEANPDQWILPYVAGWECHRARQYERAGEYFRLAAAVPGAPAHIKRLIAGMAARGGDVRRALRLWQELLDDPDSDSATRAIAERQVRALKVGLDLRLLRSALEVFRQSNGRYPIRLEHLIRAEVLREIPLDPDGRPYAYDPRTGRVSSPAGRLLGGAS